MGIYLPDTSVIIDGRITELIKSGELEKPKVIVPNAVVSELENQANKGKETGFSGLSELKDLGNLRDDGKIELEFSEEDVDLETVQLRTVDSIIRKAAMKLKATLITSDRVQAEVSRAQGVPVMFLEQKFVKKKLAFVEYFDQETLSVHLKEGVEPMAKKGTPGNWGLEKLSRNKLKRKELEELSKDIIEEAKRDMRAFIEMDMKGVSVVQFADFRIVIARPPFADGWEITVVKPIVKLTIDDYDIPPQLLERIDTSAEGILVSGAPGHGKSTFATALAEYYVSKDKIVKTMESPRDLQVSDEVTQYAPLEGSMERIADILLLVRPDYTIYDELRRTEDFRVYADLRLAGVGLVGVVHATNPIDAIQRFIGRIELGMIPEIIDTVIFIYEGRVDKVYELELVVRVPSGMFERDLSRPIVEVKDFLTKSLEYEIYTYGDQTVIIPVNKVGTRSRRRSSSREYITNYRETKKHIVITLGKRFRNRTVKLAVGDFVFSLPVQSSGKGKLSKKTGMGKKVLERLKNGEPIVVK
jgi:ATPase